MPPQALCPQPQLCGLRGSFRGDERTALKEQNRSPTELRFLKIGSQTTTWATGPSTSETAVCAVDSPTAVCGCSWKSTRVPPPQGRHQSMLCKTTQERGTSAAEVNPSSGRNR